MSDGLLHAYTHVFVPIYLEYITVTVYYRRCAMEFREHATDGEGGSVWELVWVLGYGRVVGMVMDMDRYGYGMGRNCLMLGHVP
jgi:hypothetical protein